MLAVVAGFLAVLAAVASRPAPALALSLGLAAALVVTLGRLAVRARFEGGRVTVREAVPFRRALERRLAEIEAARVETFADARRRRAELRLRAWEERSGTPAPSWLRAPDAPGTNDGLRRVVLVARGGDVLPVTAWLAEDDLEPARREVESLLPSGRG